MASIIKRKKNYSVVYYYEDENGEQRQKWETYDNHKDALKRKADVENKIINNDFTRPSNQTVSEFLKDFVALYGKKIWSLSTYEHNISRIRNYVNPIIGDIIIQKLTPKTVDQYYEKLKVTEPVNKQNRHAKTLYISDYLIYEIHKLLKCAFGQAVIWEDISKNPFEKVVMKAPDYKKRDIWTAEEIKKALNHCSSGKLYIAINLSFACSLREGEILGLTWDNVHISDKDIHADDAHVYIKQELRRFSKESLEILSERDVLFIFPPVMSNTSTRLTLKKPKTNSSERKVWLPKTVAYMLRKWKDAQDELKGFLGNEYTDYNLVIALQNGRPCESRVLLKEFASLKREAELPDVVFHSLRHSSTTYKLKLNNGDLKATQGDTGHAQIDMITDVYAHILDEDRKINAQKFETAFYTNPDLRDVIPQESKPEPFDLQTLICQLEQSPELAAALAGLIQNNAAIVQK